MTCSEGLLFALQQTNGQSSELDEGYEKQHQLSSGEHRHINTISFSAVSVTQQSLVMEKVELAIHVRATSTIFTASNKHHEAAAPRLPRCC